MDIGRVIRVIENVPASPPLPREPAPKEPLASPTSTVKSFSIIVSKRSRMRSVSLASLREPPAGPSRCGA